MSALPRHRTVSEVMTNRAHVATPLTPFKLLVRLIEENRVRAIPIVDQQGVPIGIVSEADLLLKERRQELESTQNPFHHRKRRHQRAKAEGAPRDEILTRLTRRDAYPAGFDDEQVRAPAASAEA